MKIKNLAILLVLAIILIAVPLVSAKPIVLQQGHDTNAKIPVFDKDNANANVAIDCYLTLISPSQNLVVNNGQMSFLGSGMYNYSLTSGQLVDVGANTCKVTCSNGLENGFSIFPCETTWTGLDEQTERSRLFWIYSMAIIIYFLLIFIAWKLEWTWLGFLGGIIITLPGIMMMLHGFGFMDDILIRGISMILIVIGILTMVIFAFVYNHLVGAGRLFGTDADDEPADEYDYFDKRNNED